MATFDVSALSNAFVGGAEAFGKEVLAWDIREAGVQVRTNVNTPQAMAKLEADGEPRPYRKDEDYNGATFSDRVLTAYQSKFDIELDSEDLRNEYLANLPEMPFEQFALNQAVAQYLDKVMTDALWLGVYDANGDAAADLVTGWGSIIAAEVIAATLTEIATGAITSANAVTQVEKVADGVTTTMKKRGFRVLCSYDVLQKYRIHYRTLNGHGFNRNEKGQYALDGMNAVLTPVAFMGNSQRLVATYDNNLVFGTDIERVTTHATPYLNLLRARLMMPLGCQIRDLSTLFVNDQA